MLVCNVIDGRGRLNVTKVCVSVSEGGEFVSAQVHGRRLISASQKSAYRCLKVGSSSVHMFMV